MSDKALEDAARLHAEASKIIANALAEMAHPTLTQSDIEGNARAILARLARANILVERYDANEEPAGMKWINCSDRLPTEADGDVCGCVVVRKNGNAFYVVLRNRAKYYDQWLSGACESEQGNGDTKGTNEATNGE